MSLNLSSDIPALPFLVWCWGERTHREVDSAAAHLTVMGPEAPVWRPDLSGRDFTPACHRQGNRAESGLC